MVHLGEKGNFRNCFISHPFIGDFAALLSIILIFIVSSSQFSSLKVPGFSLPGPQLLGWTVVSIIWFLTVYFSNGYTEKIKLTGAAEYSMLIKSSIRAMGFGSIVALYTQQFGVLTFLFFFYSTIAMATILARWLTRRQLSKARAENQFISNALIAGSVTSVKEICSILESNGDHGYNIIGACIPYSRTSVSSLEVGPKEKIPILGDLDDLPRLLKDGGVQTLILTSADEFSPRTVRNLSWLLDPFRQQLVIAPNILDISGPRLYTQPSAGLPLLTIQVPQLGGFAQQLKRFIDLLGSIGLLVCLSPLFLIIGILIKLDDRGPILFRQKRVGWEGELFTMYKFRSMRTDAEKLLMELNSQNRSGQVGNEIMFKLEDDPRITRVGKVLRRFSLDELPQLLNVVQGKMSLIGPRPPLLSEVEKYESHVHRKFLVKPGITGLWQVEGRSNLSWEESVRLDLYYVENWSATQDIVIAIKTLRAVFGRQGAY